MVDVIKRRTTGVDDANSDGQTMTLTVAVTGGQSPYSYQWFKNGNAISGATSASYVKASTTTADSGTYKVVVQDGYGNIISGSTVATVS